MSTTSYTSHPVLSDALVRIRQAAQKYAEAHRAHAMTAAAIEAADAQLTAALNAVYPAAENSCNAANIASGIRHEQH